MADNIVHVAVAAIVNDKNQVLIAKRPDHVHQGGLWEFPGGKIEAEETVEQALVREIKEELDIVVSDLKPLIKIKHHYKDKVVLLDVKITDKFKGSPIGAENQPIKWEKISELEEKYFPEANKNIIKALKLPSLYIITGDFNSKEDFQRKLKNSLSNNKGIVQLRCNHIKDTKRYLEFSDIAKSICEEFDVLLLLNTTLKCFNQSKANGIHLNSHLMYEYNSRPVPSNIVLSVSCHNKDEIKQAELLKADIVLLSPVKETSSHPGVKGMGWDEFINLKKNLCSPVYALGGMEKEDVSKAKEVGAQGIASISMLWSDE
jgi:8-oxo-dGTP diphosphatase